MASTICVATGAPVDLIESLRIGLREEGAVQQDVLRTSWPSEVAQVVQAADALSKIHAAAWAYGRADPRLEWGPHAMLCAGMAVARLLGGKRAVKVRARKIQLVLALPRPRREPAHRRPTHRKPCRGCAPKRPRRAVAPSTPPGRRRTPGSWAGAGAWRRWRRRRGG